MRILLAPDKFKGSLTSLQVCEALQQGLEAALPHASYIQFPLADGGDGTTDILTWHTGGERHTVSVQDPLGRPITAAYGLAADHTTAFIEMADASGLRLLKPEERRVMQTSTFGTGDLIKAALDHGATHIILGIGGSATNDAATGSATALGYQFRDAQGQPVNPVGGTLSHIATLHKDHLHPRLHQTRFTAICDVTNPFFGPQGAAHMYASQKGATPQEVTKLDNGLRSLARVIKTALAIDLQNIPGAGGGFGGGAHAFLNATLRKGVDVIFETTHFEQQIKNADLIITGEGKLDTQTLQGKLIEGVATLAKKYQKPLYVITGKNELTPTQLNKLGIVYAIALTDYTTEQQALQNAFTIIQQLALKIIQPIKT